MAYGLFEHFSKKMMRKLLLLLAFAFLLNQAYAEVFKVTISNPNNYDLIDYQVRIDLSNYLSQATYLKVFDANQNLLNFCYEQPNGECNTNPSLVIWIKVNLTANSQTVIYVQTSNQNYAVGGEQIFDFYDDFSTNTIGTVWNEIALYGGNTPTIVNGVLQMCDVDDYVYANIGNWKNVTAEIRSRITSIQTDAVQFHQLFYSDLGITSTWAENQLIYSIYRHLSTATPVQHFAWYDTALHIVASFSANVWYVHTYKIRKDVGTWDWKIVDENGNVVYSGTNLNFRQNTGTYVSILAFINNGANPSSECAEVDWVRVRKYADQEPTINIEIVGVTIIKPSNKEFISQVNITYTVEGSDVGAIAYWKMDEGSGDIVYDSADNNDGTIYNMYSLEFDGVDDYVDIPDGTNGPFSRTVTAWIYGVPTSGRYEILNWAGTYFNIQYNKVCIWIGGASTQYLCSNITLDPNTWNFVVGIYNYSENKVYVYVNGQLAGELQLTGTPNTLTGGAIGRCVWCGSYLFSFKGRIAEVRIYNRTLSDSEIQTLYEKGPGYAGDTTGLVLWHVYSKKTLVDQSGNGNDGTAYGNPQWVVDSPYSGWVDGKWGKALRFDGVDDYVEISDIWTTPNTFTVCAWVNITADGQWDTIVSQEDYNGWRMFIDETNNQFIFGFKATDGNYYQTTTPFTEYGQWTFLCGEYNGTHILLFKNGNLVQTYYVGVDPRDSTYPVIIGATYTGSAATLRWFANGTIDEIRIYNRALSEEEIKALYEKNKHKYLVNIYLDGNLVETQYTYNNETNSTIIEILKEGSYNITVEAISLADSNLKDVKSVIFTLDLYDENVTYSNYTLYNNTKYVDTLNYELKVRCGVLNYSIVIDAFNNKTYTIVCDNKTKTISDSFRFSSEGTKTVWFYLNAVNESDSRYFGNESFIADLEPPKKIDITLTNYIGIYRNNKAIATNFTVYVYDNISPILKCKILRKLTDINDNNYVIANNLTDTLNNNSSKTYSYTFSNTNINYYKDYIEVECKDLVNHTSKNTLSKYFIRQDFNFVDELLKTKTDYNRTYAVYCSDGSTLFKLTETQTADSITIITYTNCTWFSVSTEYNNIILIQDFELNLTSKYYDEVDACVPSNNQQYVVKHLVASEPYPEYLITVFNPDSGCFISSSNLKYYSQNVYYLPIPTILNQKYAISVQNVYVASVTGSETPVDISLLIQKLIQLQEVVKKMFLTYEYNITHEVTDTSVRVYIKTERIIKDILVEIWRGNQKLGTIKISDVNNNTAVISILKSQYDNFELNETKKEYLRISILFEDGFSLNIIYPKSPFGYSIPTILAWIISVLFVLYFFAVRGHYVKTIYASLSLIILSVFISLISESYAPIVFASAILLSYLLDVIYKIFIPEEIRRDIVVLLAVPLVKISLASIFVSAIISAMNLPATLPFSSDIDKIRESVEKISMQIENMLSSPLQTILTIVNVVLTAFVLLWYSMKLSMSLVIYILNTVVGGILPVSAIATIISIVIILMFIIGIIRALILARTQ